MYDQGDVSYRLKQAEQENGRIESEFTDNTATEFRAELFVDGKGKCDCRIYLGEMFGPNSICYSTGRSSGNAANEILTPSTDGELVFSAMMSMGHSNLERKFDTKRMVPEQTADYLWAMFVAPLGYR